jgi:hypothetical protein
VIRPDAHLFPKDSHLLSKHLDRFSNVFSWRAHIRGAMSMMVASCITSLGAAGEEPATIKKRIRAVLKEE